MSQVITGDKCWVYGYDPETKQMSCQWNTASSPRPKKARQVKSNVKTMLIVFFDIDGLVHHEYVPRGQMVSKEFYKTVLQRLHNTVQISPWEVALWQLDPAPWQCPCPQGYHHKWISGETQHSVTPTPSLLPWPCSVWLLLVPATEENNESSPIWLHWRHSSQHDETTEGYYKKWLPEVLSSVAGTLE